jgi:hypothetical protein
MNLSNVKNLLTELTVMLDYSVLKSINLFFE